MNTLKRLLSLALCSSLPIMGAVSAAETQVYGPSGYGRDHAPAQVQRLAQTEAASVTILAPQDGAKLTAGEPVTLEYKVVPGPQGDHVHVYVDGDEAAILRELEGSYTVETLSPGRHELAIKVVNRAHVPIGVESSIAVEVQ